MARSSVIYPKLVYSNSAFPGAPAAEEQVSSDGSGRSLENEDPAWSTAALQRLAELRVLKPGWDGYRGVPLDLNVAHFTYGMLMSICGWHSPVAQLVPTRTGGVQVEWHLEGQSIELRVVAPRRVEAWREVDGEEDVLIDLTDDFSVVTGWLHDFRGADANIAAAL
ncbi:hypothetical protein BH10PLA2_BH10PLA2_38640 [soil metagenome]